MPWVLVGDKAESESDGEASLNTGDISDSAVDETRATMELTGVAAGVAHAEEATSEDVKADSASDAGGASDVGEDAAGPSLLTDSGAGDAGLGTEAPVPLRMPTATTTPTLREADPICPGAGSSVRAAPVSEHLPPLPPPSTPPTSKQELLLQGAHAYPVDEGVDDESPMPKAEDSVKEADESNKTGEIDLSVQNIPVDAASVDVSIDLPTPKADKEPTLQDDVGFGDEQDTIRVGDEQPLQVLDALPTDSGISSGVASAQEDIHEVPVLTAKECVGDSPKHIDEVAKPDFDFRPVSRKQAWRASDKELNFFRFLHMQSFATQDDTTLDSDFRRVELFLESTTNYDLDANPHLIEKWFDEIIQALCVTARGSSTGITDVLKPFLIDMVKKKQSVGGMQTSSLIERLRRVKGTRADAQALKHMRPRDLMLSLLEMLSPASKNRFMLMASKTDSVLPLLYYWRHASAHEASIVPVINLPALVEAWGTPTFPLVLNLGTRDTTGKTKLFQNLFGTQDFPTRSAIPPADQLLSHRLPAVDLLMDVSRERPLRGFTLADLHDYDSAEADVNANAMIASLSSVSALILLHFSLDEIRGGEFHGSFADLLKLIVPYANAGCNSAKIVALLRLDAGVLSLEELEDEAFDDVTAACTQLQGIFKNFCGLWGVESMKDKPDVCDLMALRESKPDLPEEDREDRLSFRDLRSEIEATGRQLPCAARIAELFEKTCEGKWKDPHLVESTLGQFVREQVHGQNSWTRVLPLVGLQIEISKLEQEKAESTREMALYPEGDAQCQVLQGRVESCQAKIMAQKKRAQTTRQTAPHPLMARFLELVRAQDFQQITVFSNCLADWRATVTSPLVRDRLAALVQITELNEKAALTSSELAQKQACFDKVKLIDEQLDHAEISIDNCWLELMFLCDSADETDAASAEGVQVHERKDQEKYSKMFLDSTRSTWQLSYIPVDNDGHRVPWTRKDIVRTYSQWVSFGAPVHFLHHTPLQFGAYDQIRWTRQSRAELGVDFVGEALAELGKDPSLSGKQVVVISIIGMQSSGKSFLMNYVFGSSFTSREGRCTKGLFISVFESEQYCVVVLDSEGLLSMECRDPVFDKRVALMTMANSDLVIVNNRGELGRQVTELFEVCLFALNQLQMSQSKPSVAFILQCIEEINPDAKTAWLQSIRTSLDESFSQMKGASKTDLKLSDLVHLDADSIFVMPCAFHSECLFQQRISRPTHLYSMKALLLRQTIFSWVDRHLKRQAAAQPRADADVGSEAPRTLADWYSQACMNWRALEACDRSMLDFRSMQQVLLVQELQEKADELIAQHVEGTLKKSLDEHLKDGRQKLRDASTQDEFKAVDSNMQDRFDAESDIATDQLRGSFDGYLKEHSKRIKDEEVKTRMRAALHGPVRRMVESFLTAWRGVFRKAGEERKIEGMWEELERKIDEELTKKDITRENLESAFNTIWENTLCLERYASIQRRKEIWKSIVINFKKADIHLVEKYRAGVTKYLFHQAVLSLQRAGWLDTMPHGEPNIKQLEKVTRDHMQASFYTNLSFEYGVLRQAAAESPRICELMRDMVKNTVLPSVDSISMTTALEKLHGIVKSIKAVRENHHYFTHFSFFETLLYQFLAMCYEDLLGKENADLEAKWAELADKKEKKYADLQVRYDEGMRDQHLGSAMVGAVLDCVDEACMMKAVEVSVTVAQKVKDYGLSDPEKACDIALRCFGIGTGSEAPMPEWDKALMYCIDPTQYLYMSFHDKWTKCTTVEVKKEADDLQYKVLIAMDQLKQMIRELSEADMGGKTVPQIFEQLSTIAEARAGEGVDNKLLQELMVNAPKFLLGEAKSNTITMGHKFVRKVAGDLTEATSARASEESLLEVLQCELDSQKMSLWSQIKGCSHRCPQCGTKCNHGNADHVSLGEPHRCSIHLLPAFSGVRWEETGGPVLNHCRSCNVWDGRKVGKFTGKDGQPVTDPKVLEWFQLENSDWLTFPEKTHPTSSLAPDLHYDDDEEDNKEIEVMKRAWVNMRAGLCEHFGFTPGHEDEVAEYTERADSIKAGDLERIKRELYMNKSGDKDTTLAVTTFGGSGKSSSGDSKVLRRGDRYLIHTKNQTLVLEDSWSFTGSKKYLDATAVFYNGNHEKIGHLDYQTKSLSTLPGCDHSGDMMSCSGGRHRISVKLDGLPTDVAHVYIVLSAWREAQLGDIITPTVRLLESGGKELCVYRDSGDHHSKKSILMCGISKLTRNWELTAIGEPGDGDASNYGPIWSAIAHHHDSK